MHCPHCGASVSEESRFCPECGGRLQDLGNTEIVPEEELRLDDIIEEPESAAEVEPETEPEPEVEERTVADALLDLSQLDEEPPRRVIAEVVGEEPEKKNNLLKWVLIAGALLVGICLCCFLSIILLASMGE